jgi:hypothetical protein
MTHRLLCIYCNGLFFSSSIQSLQGVCKSVENFHLGPIPIKYGEAMYLIMAGMSCFSSNIYCILAAQKLGH